MLRGFVFGCFLGVLVTQVNADADLNEKVECLKNIIKDHKNILQKFGKVRSCEDLTERIEEIYEYFEDCSISGRVMDSMDALVDEFCAPGSKMMYDLVSGKGCWPKHYPLEIMKCASNFLVNLTEPEDHCPSWKPLLKCLTDSADKLCVGKSNKYMYRFVDALEAMFDVMCDALFGTVQFSGRSIEL